jgi:hypothetical protein
MGCRPLLLLSVVSGLLPGFCVPWSNYMDGIVVVAMVVCLSITVVALSRSDADVAKHAIKTLARLLGG